MMFLGIDIGSSSSKVALMNDKKELVATAVVNKGTGTDGVHSALEQAFLKAGITKEDVQFSVVTGYGRVTYKDADKQITELTCHAKGVAYLIPGARTIVDIGGQDAKVIKLNEKGEMINFGMNEKCAAGTGRFLEVMARVLGCGLGDLSDLAQKSDKTVSISSVCTVFAESEVISQLATGETPANVARGAHVSVSKRVAGMCNRVGVEPTVVMTGGVALNADMVRCLSNELSSPVTAAPNCQAVGAIGASVAAYETFMARREQ
ncbi:MAG: acyl-CoA dehydratase activase [Oscillospiraceae bacterium]|nr:acyl-CoA dehydratase activase [Oscillospiraceae bacterium]